MDVGDTGGDTHEYTEDGDNRQGGDLSYAYAHPHVHTLAHVNIAMHQLQQQQNPCFIQPVLHIANSAAHDMANKEIHLAIDDQTVESADVLPPNPSFSKFHPVSYFHHLYLVQKEAVMKDELMLNMAQSPSTSPLAVKF